MSTWHGSSLKYFDNKICRIWTQNERTAGECENNPLLRILFRRPLSLRKLSKCLTEKRSVWIVGCTNKQWMRLRKPMSKKIKTSPLQIIAKILLHVISLRINWINRNLIQRFFSFYFLLLHISEPMNTKYISLKKHFWEMVCPSVMVATFVFLFPSSKSIQEKKQKESFKE